MDQNPMYQALLRWSLTQTDGTTTNSDLKEMDLEKRQFLDRVMKEMVEDEASTMTELVAKMKGPEGTEEQVQEKEDALEELCDRVDRIDYAITLHVYGDGFLPAIGLVKDTAHQGVRARAADLLAVCMRNNPKCQKWAMDAGALHVLRAAHMDANNEESTRAKALGAIAALVQNFAEAESVFLEENGLAALRADVDGIGRRLKIKALFMLQWLLGSSEAARVRALEDKLGDRLAACVCDDDVEVVEFAALALLALLEQQRDAVQDAAIVVSNLEQRLNQGDMQDGQAEAAVENVKRLVQILRTNA